MKEIILGVSIMWVTVFCFIFFLIGATGKYCNKNMSYLPPVFLACWLARDISK